MDSHGPSTSREPQSIEHHDIETNWKEELDTAPLINRLMKLDTLQRETDNRVQRLQAYVDRAAGCADDSDPDNDLEDLAPATADASVVASDSDFPTGTGPQRLVTLQINTHQTKRSQCSAPDIDNDVLFISDSSSNPNVVHSSITTPVILSVESLANGGGTKRTLDAMNLASTGVKSPRIKRQRIDCCNADCTTTDSSTLAPAPDFVLRYFGHRHDYRAGPEGLVCNVCHELACIYREDRVAALRRQEYLFDIDTPAVLDTVVLSDSDDEAPGAISHPPRLKPFGETLPPMAVAVVNEHLSSIVSSVLERYLDVQLSSVQRSLQGQLDELSQEAEEITDTYLHFQQRLDKMQKSFYNMYRPANEELSELQVTDYRGPGNHDGTTGKLIEFSDSDDEVTEVDVLEKPVQAVEGVQIYEDEAEAQSTVAFVAPQMVDDDVLIYWQQTSDPANVSRLRPELPPVLETVPRPPLNAGYRVFAARGGLLSAWVEGRVAEVMPPEEGQPTDPAGRYRVTFDKGPDHVLTGRQLAYHRCAPCRLKTGNRVVAMFKDERNGSSNMYAGMVAEPPKQINKYRALVFFDDGYSQYVPHGNVRFVVHAGSNSIEEQFADFHEDVRNFFRTYHARYPERPMVKLTLDQLVKCELNGKWCMAKVLEVDASLCHLVFQGSSRKEWLYRGSERFQQVYSLSKTPVEPVATPRRNQNRPFVEFTQIPEEGDVIGEVSSEPPAPKRSVAKKSTSHRPRPALTPMTLQPPADTPADFSTNLRADSSTDPLADLLVAPTNGATLVTTPAPNVPVVTRDPDSKPGRVVHDLYDPSSGPQCLRFVPHQCGPPCLKRVPYDKDAMRHCGPMTVPLLLAWNRDLGTCCDSRAVLYRAPCGRRIRNDDELSRFLRVTKTTLTMDAFSFDPKVSCIDEFKLDPDIAFVPDLTNGMEHVPISCVNHIDNVMPPSVRYTVDREPAPDVFLNLDPDFLIGCDCTDGCQDKDKCACWQLTFAGTAYGSSGVVDNSIGYNHKRLKDPVLSGIYECNSRCKCTSTCTNRVVQNPLRCKLQVFRTKNRGWGIRSLNDIAAGAFISVYAGVILTEQSANEGGKAFGDEYLAELDYIEVVERLKEDYEHEVKFYFGEEVVEQPPLTYTPSKRTNAISDGESRSDNSDDDHPLKTLQHQLITSREETAREHNRNKQLEIGESSRNTRSSLNKQNTEKLRRERDRATLLSEADGSSDTEDGHNVRLPQRVTLLTDPEPIDEEDVEEAGAHYKSAREYFNDTLYIMDAKNAGNVSRYLNHSCSPNVFVQNVFVDTHDLRFPVVAFFAMTHITAGTELTWNYNYEIGSVQNKVLQCHCGAPNCVGRLL